MVAAARQAKSETADRARQSWRRQRMMPENSADQSVGRSWNIQYPWASERSPGAEMNRPPPADNEARHFLDMMVRAQRAGDLLANSPFGWQTHLCTHRIGQWPRRKRAQRSANPMDK